MVSTFYLVQDLACRLQLDFSRGYLFREMSAQSVTLGEPRSGLNSISTPCQCVTCFIPNWEKYSQGKVPVPGEPSNFST